MWIEFYILWRVHLFIHLIICVQKSNSQMALMMFRNLISSDAQNLLQWLWFKITQRSLLSYTILIRNNCSQYWIIWYLLHRFKSSLFNANLWLAILHMAFNFYFISHQVFILISLLSKINKQIKNQKTMNLYHTIK